MLIFTHHLEGILTYKVVSVLRINRIAEGPNLMGSLAGLSKMFPSTLPYLCV